ncbi:MAG: hypothetical protein HY556_06615 [Euryarchaeota archaeon]|nr:hypothetical protein [Euryarchaeota archaeon]
MTRKPALATILMTLGITLAGCVSQGPDPAPSIADLGEALPPIDFDDLFELKHNHSDPDEHQWQTSSMHLIAHHALGDVPGVARGSYGEMDVYKNLAAIATLGEAGELAGIVLMDITTAYEPKLLSFTPVYHMPRLADLKFSDDGKYVFAATQRYTTNANLQDPTSAQRKVPQPNQSTAMDDTERAQWIAANGIQVYDAADPTKPLPLLAWTYQEYGVHMLSYKRIAGREYLFSVGSTILVYEFLRDSPAGESIRLVSQYNAQDSDGVMTIVGNDMSSPFTYYNDVRLGLRPHDMTVQDDPLTGKPVMYVSYWDWGACAVDVSDPQVPVELGCWQGEGAVHYTGNIHTAMATLVAGKRYIVAIPELIDNSIPSVFVMDATDYSSMKLAAEWVAPGIRGADGIRFSTHNFQLIGSKMYLAFYHAGVWVLDLAQILSHDSGHSGVKSDGILGIYQKTEPTKMFNQPVPAGTNPDFWEVVVTNGFIHAIDIPTGLYVLHYVEDPTGDASYKSFA